MSAGFAGVTGEISVDVNNFDSSEQTNKEFGEEQPSYKVGGDDFPEPIQMEIISIDETLDVKFWGNLDELKNKPLSPCRRMSKVKLPKMKKNIAKAIKDYPRRMKVHRAKGMGSLYSPKFLNFRTQKTDNNNPVRDKQT